jgi:AGZA family xanthine/uracil permease-like MFS transporter
MAVQEARFSGMLNQLFKISQRGSSVRTEIIAGITTFLTMGYILFVNPSILGLGGDGLPFGQVLSVTALAAGVMTIAMGIFGNYPFAIAAGLGLNAFVAYALVGGGLTFPQAMGVVVAEGLLITLLVITGVREAIVDAIPMDLKRAIGIGIGAFIALIGLVEAGIVSPEGATPLALGANLTSQPVAVFLVGFVITAGLVARRVKGALLIGIVVSTAMAVLVGVSSLPQDGIVAMPDFSLIGAFDFSFVEALGWGTALAVVVSVALSDFFDTMGTVVGIGGEANLLDKDGKLPGMRNVLLVDSLAAVVGGLTSSSSNTTYIESASGVAEGGRTGLASVVTGLLFLAMMFVSPLAGVVPAQATAPALVIVGYFMMTLVKDIKWSDPGIGIPALLTILLMPFTYSITNGVGAGFLAYVILAALRGKAEEVHWLLWIVAIVFAWYFVHGAI